MLNKILPLALLGAGVFVLVQVIMPFASFKVWEAVNYSQNVALISPNPEDTEVLGVSIQNQSDFPAIISSNTRESVASYQQFYLSLPSINLEKAKVLVDSNVFDQNLAHLPGSALPGEKGNVFITGHSSLPQFFKQDNYKAIFAHLPEVKKGDTVYIDAGGQRFEYIVKGLKIVDPKETWVINPPEETGRYLSLMTCVPPGLYLKRLIVLAELKGF